MNPLLERQIRKYLPDYLKGNPDIITFLKAIDQSYNSADEQFSMLQRATKLSSDELYETNKKLEKESTSQKQVIEKLNNVINSLKIYELESNKDLKTTDSLSLVDFIQTQTQEMLRINKQKDKLVSNLERQNQELNDYAHMVSHDLKSPLQSIDALTTWMVQDHEENLGESGKEIINHIKENVEKMDALIEGILEYSTIDKIKKKQYPINLNTLVEECIYSVDNPYNVKIKVVDNLPTIIGDQYRLELLFHQLIDNAVKFNNKKELGLVTISSEDLGDKWQIKITDNGKGIQKDFFNKIFIAFQKLENNYKSTGIGLSIAKKIVEAYGGEISVISEPNVETSFIFTLKK